MFRTRITAINQRYKHIKVEGFRIKVEGFRIKVEGFRIKVEGFRERWKDFALIHNLDQHIEKYNVIGKNSH